MNIASLTPVTLKRIARLVEAKENLQAQVAQIDAELSTFGAGELAAPARSTPSPKPGRRGKAKRAARGAVKAAIVEVLKAVGGSGITVKDLGAKLGLKYNRVFTWFYTTGSSIKEIRKVAPGQYAWLPAPARGAQPVAKPAPAAKPVKTTKPSGPRHNGRRRASAVMAG